MIAAAHLLATLLICSWAVRPLATARWVWRAPSTGIILWQMVGLTWVSSAVGLLLAIGLAPYDAPIPVALLRWCRDLPGGVPSAGHSALVVAGLLATTGLVVTFAVSWFSVLRVRRRHRDVLALVAREDRALPGALIIEHPLAVAYCLPGMRGAVVLSSGALRALSRDEALAVLAHEQSHARERHDLVLLPFTALRRALPRLRLVTIAADAIALLVEMRADDGACRHQNASSLAAALRRFSTSPARPPAGALGVADTAVAARLSRIGDGSPIRPALRWFALFSGLVVASTPLSFLVF